MLLLLGTTDMQCMQKPPAPRLQFVRYGSCLIHRTEPAGHPYADVRGPCLVVILVTKAVSA
jgi:hypothetical protein